MTTEKQKQYLRAKYQKEKGLFYNEDMHVDPYAVWLEERLIEAQVPTTGAADLEPHYTVKYRETASTLLNPDWEKRIGMPHVWQNHVPREVRADWERLTIDERCLVIHMAQEQADKEEWE